MVVVWLNDLVFLPQAGVRFPSRELIKALQEGDLQMDWRCAAVVGSSFSFGALLTTILLQAGFAFNSMQVLLDILPKFHFVFWHSSFWEFWNVCLQLNDIKLTKVRLEKLGYTFGNGLSNIIECQHQGHIWSKTYKSYL